MEKGWRMRLGTYLGCPEVTVTLVVMAGRDDRRDGAGGVGKCNASQIDHKCYNKHLICHALQSKGAPRFE